MVRPRGLSESRENSILVCPTSQNGPLDSIGELKGLSNPWDRYLAALGIENSAPEEDRDGFSSEAAESISKHQINGGAASAFAVTRFKDVTGKNPRRLRLNLCELADELASHTASNKAGLPLFKLATFNGPRNDNNVEAVSGIEADYDGEEIGFYAACFRAEEAGIRCIVHTTPSHTHERPRWRVLAPLSEAHPPEERRRFLDRLNEAFGDIFDASSGTLSQAFYGGNVEGVPPMTVRVIEGMCIDRAHGLERAAKQPERSKGEKSGLSWNLFASAVTAIPNDGDFDDRSAWLGVLAAIYHESDGGRDGRHLALDFSERWETGNHNDRDFASAWRSFRRHGAKACGATIIPLAREYGWYEDLKAEFDDLPPVEPEQLRAKSRLSFLTPRECEGGIHRPYLVKGILAKGDVGCIFGAPGAGKSVITPYLGYRVAQGEAAFGNRTRQGGVFYVAPEDEFGLRNRVSALRKAYGDADEFRLVGGVSNLSEGSQDYRDLMKAIEREKPALIIVDTLAMAFPGLEENSSEAMGKVVKVARRLASFGAAVLLVHHDTKEAGGTPRGHSVLNGALDMSIYVSKTESGFIRGELKKNRNGPVDQILLCAMNVEEVGIDEDGDAISAVFAREAEATPDGPRLSRQQQDILEKVRTCPTMSVEELRRELTKKGVISTAPAEDSRRKAVSRGLKQLVDTRCIAVKNGSYRVVHHDCGFSDIGHLPDMSELSSGSASGQTRTGGYSPVRMSGPTKGPSQGRHAGGSTDRDVPRAKNKMNSDSAGMTP